MCLCELTRAPHSLSTCDSRPKAFEAFVTLGGLPPRRLGVTGELPSCGEQRQVCEGCDLAPLVEKIALVELRKVVERDPACCGRPLVDPLQAPQRRRSLSLVGGELRKTNPCVSIVVCLSSCFVAYLLCFRFDLRWCAYLCVQGSLPFL